MSTGTRAPNVENTVCDLVSDLAAGLLIGHRGANLVFSEHSMEGYRAVAAAGFPPEPDVRALADGTLVCIHDDTLLRTMTGAIGDVASLTRDEWDRARITPAPGSEAGARPVTFDEVLDELGGRILIVPEIKVYDSESVTAFIAAIVERGLRRAVLVQSFDYGVAVRLAEAGMATLFLVDPRNLPVSFADIRAAGIEYVGTSVNDAGSVIAEAAREGLRCIVWTANTRQAAQEQFGQGAFGVFSDDVWTVSGQFAPALSSL